MKKTKVLHVLLQYLRQCFQRMLWFAAYSGIFAITLALYGLPLEALGYAGVLCAVVAGLHALYSFIRFYQRHIRLNELQTRIALDTDELPTPQGLLEADYQQLIEALHRDKLEAVSTADIAKRDMEDYFTLWAHQIKTPIAAMRLLLQSGEASDQSMELTSELFMIEQYVETVLTYLRFSSDTTDFVLRQTDLDSIVRRAVRKTAKLFIRKKLSLEYTAVHLNVLTDEKWVAFVLEQLLLNALQYTIEGKIVIRLDCENRLVIEDTGIGIAPEDLPRIFEKSFTGYNGRRDQKSTGLGLYLCKQIITKLSHTIEMQSEAGKGTRVLLAFETVDIAAE